MRDRTFFILMAVLITCMIALACSSCIPTGRGVKKVDTVIAPAADTFKTK